MAKVGKKLREARKQIDASKSYSLLEAIELAKETSYASFETSIDLALRLNLDTRKADQQLRGSIVLPHGNGKETNVLVVTDNPELKRKSLEAGADNVVDKLEFEEVIKEGKFEFDVIVADPKMMPTLGRHGRVLGPKGLMPNPKVGTVTPTPEKAVTEIKSGKANYRADKFGIVHTLIGKKNMESKALAENAQTIIDTIKRLKPSAVKGVYLKNITVSASMGPSVKISLDS